MLALSDVAQASDLTGTWQGSYLCGSGKTNLTLTITHTPSHKLQAEFAFQVVNGRHRNVRGRFAMQGNYQVAKGTFRLAPTQLIEMPRGFIPTPLSGELTGDGTRLTGRIESPGCSRFDVTRDASVPGVQATATPVPRAKPPAAAVNLGTEACERIVAWSDRAEQEYPELTDPKLLVTTALKRRQPLFADANFIPVFGKSFADLDPNEIKMISLTLRKCFSGPGRDSNLNVWKRQSLDRPFFTTLRDYPVFVNFVVTARTNHTWREQSLQALEQLKDSSREVYNKATSFAYELSSHDVDMWPSERVAFVEKLAKERQRGAELELVYVVDNVLDLKASFDTLNRIYQVLDSKQLLDDNVPEVKQRETSRLQQRMDDILTGYLKQDDARLQQRGNGLGALSQGLIWHQEFKSRYHLFWAQPTVAALEARFTTQRESDLQAAHDELIQQFSKSTHISVLEADVKLYLDSRVDGESPQGRKLFAALEYRKKEIKIEEEVSKYSPREHKLMITAGQLPIQVPDSYSEPDSGEIHLAIMRELTSLGGRLLSGTRADLGVPPFDQFLYLRAEFKQLDKKSCKQSNPGQYTCSYRHGLAFSIPEESYAFLRMGGRSVFLENMVNDYIKALNSEEPATTTHTFVLTSTGWRSPSIREKGLKAILDTYQEMLASWPECRLMDWGGGKFTCE